MRFTIPIAGLLLAAACIGPAAAQSASHNEIGNDVLSGARGNMAINSSAGSGNAQSNMAVIAVGANQATADIRSRQQAAGSESAEQTQRAVIGERAFRGGTGIVAVNQSSGNGNAQANLVAVAAGRYAEVSIEHLGTVSAAPVATTRASAAEGGPRREQRAVVADSAFAGATGIVQLNQLAGSGNNTVNAFALSVGSAPQQ